MLIKRGMVLCQSYILVSTWGRLVALKASHACRAAHSMVSWGAKGHLHKGCCVTCRHIPRKTVPVTCFLIVQPSANKQGPCAPVVKHESAFKFSRPWFFNTGGSQIADSTQGFEVMARQREGQDRML